MKMRTLSLATQGHCYLFRYAPGCEDAIVDEFMVAADDPDAPLDWLDAATLSFQVAQCTAESCDSVLKPARDPVE